MEDTLDTPQVPEVIGGMQYRDSTSLKVPKWIRDKVEKDGQGRPRPAKAVAWFFRFLETGQATQSVLDVGWNGKSHPSWRAHKYKQQFGDLLAHAVMYQRQWEEPKAVRMLGYVMDVAMSPKNSDNAQMLAVGVKAAGEILDRGKMPKGAIIHGVETTPSMDGVERSLGELIDGLVASIGDVETVRRMKVISERKDHRDYFESKWPQAVIEAPAGATEET